MRALLLVVAAPLLIAAAGEPYTADEKKFRFELTVETAQGGTYVSAWADGPVIADHDGSDHKTITYRRTFRWYDGCDWESRETIVPVAADRYTYAYAEEPVSCPTRVSPDGAVRRTGTIKVFTAGRNAPITPIVARVTLAN
jgi:hypothetical protein